MSAEHIHLLLNHGPLFAVVFSIPLLIIGFLRRNTTLSRTALAGYVTAAVLTIPVYLSGEEAEHAVEELPGVSEYFLEEHEDAGKLTLWLVEALGLVSAVVLVVSARKPEVPRGLQLIVLAVSAGAVVAVAYTNNLGGKIRHSELRSATVPAESGSAPVNQEHQYENNEHNDDSH